MNQSQAVLSTKIKIKYIPSELKLRYGYANFGVRRSGLLRLIYGKWEKRPTYGLQLDPLDEFGGISGVPSIYGLITLEQQNRKAYYL
jgi:hypothetical protein